MSVQIDGRAREGALRGRKSRELLAYLVLNRSRTISRDELVEAVWPLRMPASPQGALRTQLSRLRAALGAEILEGTSALSLRIADDAWVDVEAARAAADEAEAAIAARRWQEAWASARVVANVAGRVLLPGSDAPWIDQQRRELTELELRGLDSAARAGLALGGSEIAAAERAARALIAAAPLSESGYLHLMEALGRRGEAALALQQFDHLRLRLAEELGAAPSAEARALHERLLGVEAEQGTPTPSDGGRRQTPQSQRLPAEGGSVPLPAWFPSMRAIPFMGRVRALGELWAHWGAVETGERRVIALHGEAGVGKSRLATELAATIHKRGGTVLWGRCGGGGSIPYQPFLEALTQWAGHAPGEELECHPAAELAELNRVVPEIGARLPELPAPSSGEPEAKRFRLFEAIAAALQGSGSRAPILLVVDDLHLASDATLVLLAHLARSPRPARIMLLAIYRETEARGAPAGLLSELRGENLLATLELDGMSRFEVEELISALAGATEPSSALATAIWKRAAGNPFFATEILEDLREAGDGDPASATAADVRDLAVPKGVRDVISHRVRRLGENARRALQAGSVLGTEIEVDLLGELAEIGEAELEDAIDEALAGGLLEERPATPEHCAFAHALVRETIYEGIGARRRARLHRAAGELIERRAGGAGPAAAATLAHHFFAAARIGDIEKAIEYAIAAGERASSMLGYEEAVRQFRRALGAMELAEIDAPQRRCEMLLALGYARRGAADPLGARETLASAAEIAAREARPDQLGRAALGYAGPAWESFGIVDEPAIALLEQAAQALKPAPTSLLASVLARLAAFLLFAGAPERVDTLSREAVAIARELDEPRALADALIARQHALWNPAGVHDRLGLADELLAVTERLGDGELIAQARRWRIDALLRVGRFDEVRDEMQAHARLADGLQDPFHRLYAKVHDTLLALLEGRLDDGERLAGQALEVGDRPHSTDAVQFFGVHMLTIYLERGGLATLEAPVREFIEQYPGIPGWRACLALVHCENGRHAEARAELEAITERLEELPFDVNWIGTMALAAIACEALGEAGSAQRLYEQLTPYGDQIVVVSGAAAVWGSVPHYLGLLSVTCGELDRAADQFERAIAAEASIGAAAHLARSRWFYARTLRSRGRPGDGERSAELAEQALTSAEQLGMTRLLEAAHAA